MAQQEVPLPFYMQFAAGAIAGVTEILVMYPLDVVKVCYYFCLTIRPDFNCKLREKVNSIVVCWIVSAKLLPKMGMLILLTYTKCIEAISRHCGMFNGYLP